MDKNNNNLKKGNFKIDELNNYLNLNKEDIDVILDYQKKLPILQEDNGEWIDGRILHEQLVKFQKVDKDDNPIEGTKFATWIERRIDKYGFTEGRDYTSAWVDGSEFKFEHAIESKQKMAALGYSLRYEISLDMAKQLSMVENNDIGTIARKYFIAIERAFKSRYEWNIDRYKSIEMFHELQSALTSKEELLKAHLPKWWTYNNIYTYESHMLNTIIIGMSASEYRDGNGLNKSKPIRNTFSEEQLYRVHKLEEYDVILLDINDIVNTEERFKLLNKYHREKLCI